MGENQLTVGKLGNKWAILGPGGPIDSRLWKTKREATAELAAMLELKHRLMVIERAERRAGGMSIGSSGLV